ncbi:M50 family metallopeptidase [Anoxybacillus geothermalis]|uniref:M50 family metallopeptidase n=1 Tax=Geobacillus sp. WSUCF-018B TaxID=2055939 RepID=UPI000C286438|nr:M50 family metallopeptidase [Geobacillus sp. WSUCF-018B]MED0654523.1 M50 family metallopeptidase [Anoxybacillus geothermalis]QHN50011.1 stage IV sporulation protein FB [Geobacillus stearothermophilus]MED4925462.1 M50 family metallopeptidase [Anoxybacillus geothermalis]MED5072824.1 M50 family metallopeptidase [Anoxybacillus geothermalis]PJW18827.1 stage IV sporulation protein FB [Geobacillus sp. WSUCF-018B]
MNKYIGLLGKLHVHPLLWLIGGMAVLTAHFKQLCLLFFIVLVHELGHAAAAAFFSWRVKRILLLPFGGVAEVEEHGNRPFREEWIVTLAGPAQHLWLGAAAFFFWKAGWMDDGSWELFFRYNVAVFGLNLLPVWPLDGGKLLFLLLSYRRPFSEAHRNMVAISAAVLVAGVILLLVAAPRQLELWVIAAFLAHAVWQEWKQHPYIVMRFLLERYYGKKGDYTRLQTITASAEERISAVLHRFYRGQKHAIVVTGGSGERMTLDENELLHAFFAEKRTDAPLGALIY